MKKIIFIGTIILIGIIISFNTFTFKHKEIKKITNSTITYVNDYQTTEVDVTTLNKNDYLKNIVTLNGDYNQKEVNEMMERLSLIDIKLLEGLIDCEGQIILTSEAITELSMFNHLKGVLPKGRSGNDTWDYVPGVATQNYAVARIGYSLPSYNTNHGTIILELHESSHLIDSCVFNNVSNTKEFKNIQQLEKENLFANQTYYDYVEEYFAETLTLYFYEPQTLVKYAPQTFNYFTKLINSL